jgi:hypothetical protein
MGDRKKVYVDASTHQRAFIKQFKDLCVAGVSTGSSWVQVKDPVRGTDL